MTLPLRFPVDPPPVIDPGPLRRAERGLEDLALVRRALPADGDGDDVGLAREALASGRIAGDSTTLRAWLAGGAVTDAARDHIAAARFARTASRDQGRPISMRFMNEIHRRLLAGVGRGARPGLDEELAALGKFVHTERDLPPLVRAALIHAQFVSLRPFAHGNGRAGRMLLTLLLPDPPLAPSVFFEQRRAEYVRLLQGVHAGEWSPWITFFLVGVATGAEERLTMIRELLALAAGDQQRTLAAATTAVSGLRLLARLPAHPVVTVADVTRLLATTKPTAAKAVGALVELGVLTEITGRRRDRAYAYREYLDLVCGDAG